MILLGAGASKPFGIPTMKEFSSDFIEDLKERGHNDLIDEIENILSIYNLPVDFEAIYSILESLNNPLSYVKNSGPAVAFYVKNPGLLPKNKDYSKALQEARNIIYDKCTISNENFSMVRQCYDELFQSVNSMMSREGKKWEPGTALIDVTNMICTTNYDMSLEWYFTEKEKDYIDGYEIRGSPFLKKYNPNVLYSMNSGERINRIIKLHGSIWQFIRNGEMIKTTLDPKTSALPYEIDIEDQMMIYPTKEKDILNYHYFPFFHIFKNWEWSRLIVIGFSFRDDPINSAIIENLYSVPESRLVIINPDPSKALENLKTYSASNLKEKINFEKIHLVSAKFGEESFKTKLFNVSNEIYDNYKT